MNWLDVSVLGKYLDLRFIRWVQAVVQHNEQAADVGWLERGLTFQCHTRVQLRTQDGVPSFHSALIVTGSMWRHQAGREGCGAIRNVGRFCQQSLTFYLDAPSIDRKLRVVYLLNWTVCVEVSRIMMWFLSSPGVHFIIRGNGVKK